MKKILQKTIAEPERIADAIADRVVRILGKQWTVQRIRNSQIISAIIGTSGLTLFLLGIEKLFINLSGWALMSFGLALLAMSGLLLKKLPYFLDAILV